MAPIAATAWRTTSPPRSASALADATEPLASAAPAAVRRTVAVISSRAAAVSSSVAACCSVRCDRWSVAWLISPAPSRMLPAVAAIAFIASCRASMAPLKSCFSCR